MLHQRLLKELPVSETVNSGTSQIIIQQMKITTLLVGLTQHMWQM